MVKTTQIVLVLIAVCCFQIMFNPSSATVFSDQKSSKELPAKGTVTSIAVKDFIKQSDYNDVKISPDGQHFALTMPDKSQTVLAIMSRSPMKIIYVYRLGEDSHIEMFHWISNRRLVFDRTYKKDYLAHPVSYNEIYAGNIDGSEFKSIFGYNTGSNEMSRFKKAKPSYSWGSIISVLDDAKHIIVLSRPMNKRYDSPIFVYKVNALNGTRTTLGRTPFGNMNVLVDQKGDPLMSYGLNENGEYQSFFYRDDEWILIDKNDKLYGYKPVFSSTKRRKVYLTQPVDGKTIGLYEYNADTQSLKKLYHNPTYDFFSTIIDPFTSNVIGVKVMKDKMVYHYFDKTNRFSKSFSVLTRSFAGDNLSVTSSTQKGNEVVILVSSDQKSGDYYLYNAKTYKATFLLSRFPALDPNLMSKRKEIQFTTRDKQQVYGYLTLPPKKQKAGLKGWPMVVLVHGGPFEVQDKWMFDSEAQLLAHHGYAVLQINYRGSSGYGVDFVEKAYRKQGSMIQQDIIDGTRWAMSRSEIDHHKVCIMGWSFGGYSAVMAPIIAPDLFKCSIAASGLYDLLYQEKEADYASIDSMSAFASVVYGSDEERLRKFSPLNRMEEFNIPLFIAHGGKDTRTPFEHAERLREKMDLLNKPYVWLYKENEGHGFYDVNNKVDFYSKALLFLNQNLKNVRFD